MFKSHLSLCIPWFLQGHATGAAKASTDNVRNYDDIACMCLEIQYQKYLLSGRNSKFRYLRVQPDYTVDL